MDAKTTASNLPIVTLHRRGMQKAGVPDLRHRDGSSVCEIDG